MTSDNNSARKPDTTEKHSLIYNHILSDIQFIKYNSFSEPGEQKTSRMPIQKIREALEKEGKISLKQEKLELIVKDIISHKFQSNLVKFKMLQQQEILRGMAHGGISPEEAILILLDQTTGDEIEEKILSKGKISPQSMDELYKFYSKIGDNIDRLSQKKNPAGESQKTFDTPFFKEKL